MTIAQLVAPVAMPVTLATVKAYIRVEHTHEDSQINDLIATATDHVENMCGCKLMTQTWRQYFDNLPHSRILKLELFPIQSLNAVHIYDMDGVLSNIHVNTLKIDFASRPSWVLFPKNVRSEQMMNGIELDIIAGYGDSPDTVPASLKSALLQLIAAWYEIRGTTAWIQGTVPIPQVVEKLVSPYKCVRL